MSDRDHDGLGLERGRTIIREYDPRWGRAFEHEARMLRRILGELVAHVEHVGSTAVPGLAAKPVLDIALAFTSDRQLGKARRLLKVAGYEDRGDQGDQGGVVLAKGPPDARTHYLHLVRAHSEQWLRYIAFRETLRRDPLRRANYAALKKRLASRFPFDRPSYQGAKGKFIEDTIVSDHIHRRPLG